MPKNHFYPECILKRSVRKFQNQFPSWQKLRRWLSYSLKVPGVGDVCVCFSWLPLTPENFANNNPEPVPDRQVGMNRRLASRLKSSWLAGLIYMNKRAATVHRNSTIGGGDCLTSFKAQSNDPTGVNYPPTSDFSLWSVVRYVRLPFVLVQY